MAKKTQNAQSSHFHIKTELMQRALDKRQTIVNLLKRNGEEKRRQTLIVASVTIILFDTTCYLNCTFL